MRRLIVSLTPAVILVLGSAPAPHRAVADSGGGDLGIVLQIGECVQFEVDACRKFNEAGVYLEAGAHYEFFVAPGDVWYDARICCDAGGWTSDGFGLLRRAIVNAAAKNRRCVCADWFELIGTIGCDERHHFRIGCRGAGWTYAPCCSGPLYAFANDVPRRYGNNSGSLCVTVCRVAAPGRPLPCCGP